MQKARQRRQRREGMTLIEIMIVVVIMAMIAGAAGFGVVNAKKKVDIDLARTTAQNIAAASQGYMLSTRGAECPTVQLLHEEHVLKRGTDPNDPWGNPYQIECDEHDINVRSAGPDEEPGSADDIALF